MKYEIEGLTWLQKKAKEYSKEKRKPVQILEEELEDIKKDIIILEGKIDRLNEIIESDFVFPQDMFGKIICIKEIKMLSTGGGILNVFCLYDKKKK